MEVVKSAGLSEANFDAGLGLWLAGQIATSAAAEVAYQESRARYDGPGDEPFPLETRSYDVPPDGGGAVANLGSHALTGAMA